MKNKNLITMLIIFVLCAVFSLVIPFSVNSLDTNANTADPSSQDSSSQSAEDNTQAQFESKEIILYKDNWFDVVNEYWTKYTNAQVIDVATLTKYTVQRVGGYNHADVEPINATETAKMLSLYGSWSWVRRPVWVKINDKYFAASINGYPHSYDLVSGNNMTGHTCIHFYMSRTHASNNWDPDHKAAVESAFAAQTKFQNYVKSL